MLADPEVAKTMTLLGQRGSGVKLGNMLLVPLEGGDDPDALLYLRPMYVEASGSQPAVQQIIAAYGERVRICASVELVLAALLVDDNEVGDQCENITPVILSQTAETPTVQSVTETTTGSGATPEPDSAPEPDQSPDGPNASGAKQLLIQAQSAFQSANEALEVGDLGAYQDLINQGQSYVSQASELLAE